MGSVTLSLAKLFSSPGGRGFPAWVSLSTPLGGGNAAARKAALNAPSVEGGRGGGGGRAATPVLGLATGRNRGSIRLSFSVERLTADHMAAFLSPFRSAELTEAEKKARKRTLLTLEQPSTLITVSESLSQSVATSPTSRLSLCICGVS